LFFFFFKLCCDNNNRVATAPLPPRHQGTVDRSLEEVGWTVNKPTIHGITVGVRATVPNRNAESLGIKEKPVLAEEGPIWHSIPSRSRPTSISCAPT
jgi:hypothetical protein